MGTTCAQPVCGCVNGICISKTQCNCSANWTGTSCNIPLCSAIEATDNRVCSARGSCIGPNVCNCTFPFAGANCELCVAGFERKGEHCIAVCYGQSADSSTVCSGRGQCIRFNTCNCTIAGYVGNQCEMPTCNGIMANHTQVCSARGICTMASTCQCQFGFAGANCETELRTCFGVLASNSSVCSSNGQCNKQDGCTCNRNFFGKLCNVSCPIDSGFAISLDQTACVPTCFGIPAFNTTVCSNNGICQASDNCKCHDNYNGQRCQNGPPKPTPSPSSPKPTVSTAKPSVSPFRSAVIPKPFACDDGYQQAKNGSQVCLPVCFDKTESEACSKNGFCSSPNKCQCTNANMTGVQCEIAKPTCNGNAICTIQCFGTASTNSSACSNNGVCIKNETCQCLPGFTGANCETMLCYDIASNDARVCSARGKCVANKCECVLGFTGKACNETVIGNTNVATRGATSMWYSALVAVLVIMNV